MKSCKKLFHTFVKNNFWDLNIKEYSTTLIPHKMLRKKNDKKREGILKSKFEGFRDKNEILDLLLKSELKPYINLSRSLLLKSYLDLKCNSTMPYSFVVDSAVAKSVVDIILPELIKERSLVVEGNPGLGLITLHLLKAQVPKIHLYDNSKLKNFTLQEIINAHPNRIEFANDNIFVFKRNKIVEVLDNALKLNVCNKIIGVVRHTQFFNHLIRNCITCYLWESIEVTNFFLVVSKNILKNVIENNEYRQKYLTYCFFNLIFKTELLEEYPSAAFLPRTFSLDDKMYLVKISKRPNFPGNFTDNDIKSLLNLCKILGRTKFNYIIPTLEEWIPECGPYLISKGISVTNQINDISADEFKLLYLFLKKFRGFHNFEIVD